MKKIFSYLKPHRGALTYTLFVKFLASMMDLFMAGRTAFVIAHRLSTIRSADTILVVRDGNIVEQGRHEDLMAEKGFYASLYKAQFETY